MSRAELADAVNITLCRTYTDRNVSAHYVDFRWVGKLERGEHRWPSAERRAALRLVLAVSSDAAIGLYCGRRTSMPTVDHDDQGESPEKLGASAELMVPVGASAVLPWSATASPPLGEPLDTYARGSVEQHLWTLPGRTLSGAVIPVQVHPAVLEEHVMAEVPDAYGRTPFLRQPGRALVVGQVGAPDHAAFVVDSRYARRRLRDAGVGARLLIPTAYRLDDLTLALIWAVGTFDDALLADDAVIAASMHRSAGYALMTASAVSGDIAPEAMPATHMWLGSQFCADHVRRHTPVLTGPPVFWTREQCGEQAASWLLFDHKQRYLSDTAPASAGDSVIRAFCIPREAVTASPPSERALLVLAVALMESYGICTAITDAPDLAGTPGFVSDRQRTAITATWIGANGIWYVDVADDRSTLREYDDAIGFAISHSVTSAPTAHRRLHATADYMGVDWHWLSSRCAELAVAGTAGIAQPRSRLLSLAGVDRACQFIAEGRRDNH